jgi:phosphoribosylanthranilate isomerase
VQRTRIKICGIARVEDAVAAARFGADAIGMVFHPPVARNVPLERARQIMAALPAFVTPVGLFVDAETRLILEICEELRLRHVQLHGRETPEQVAELRGLAVIKALPVDPETFAGELANWREAMASPSLSNLKALVLETGGTKQAGGTGIENNWAVIAEHQRRGDFASLPPIIAAGGLNPHNVAQVVRALNPWAVDVSSGVESFLGHKSPEKIEAFVSAVRGADAGDSRVAGAGAS